MFGINPINGSVQWLGVPDFLRTDGPAWNDNLLDPHTSWGDRGFSTNPKCINQSGGHFDSGNHPIRKLPVYHVGYLKICAPLRAPSVTISLEPIIWCACKVPLLTANPSAIHGASGMTTEMISGMIRLINNFCGEFPLVVSVSVNFPFFSFRH